MKSSRNFCNRVYLPVFNFSSADLSEMHHLVHVYMEEKHVPHLH